MKIALLSLITYDLIEYLPDSLLAVERSRKATSKTPWCNSVVTGAMVRLIQEDTHASLHKVIQFTANYTVCKHAYWIYLYKRKLLIYLWTQHKAFRLNFVVYNWIATVQWQSRLNIQKTLKARQNYLRWRNMNKYIAEIFIQTHICTHTDTRLIKISVLAVTV